MVVCFSQIGFDLCLCLWCSLCCRMLFVSLSLGVACCSVVDVWDVVTLVLYVMRVVGDVLLCEFRHVGFSGC